MKRCEEIGVPMTEKLAKGIVRKFGKRKDHLTAEDCAKVIHRRYANLSPGKQRGTTPKKAKAPASSGKR